MLLWPADNRLGTFIRLAGLALIVLSFTATSHHPGSSGRGLLISVLLAAAVAAWLVWTVRRSVEHGISPELYVMALAGGALTYMAPASAGSAFAFVAVASGGMRTELYRAAPLLAVATLALAASSILYDKGGVGTLAYVLGFAAAMLGGSSVRQRVQRLEQAELLMAQMQRSHEEQLRSARLEESARIARDIHDVLAHALAGLAIQLEATAALVEQGADRDTVLTRINRAHGLAREGLRETRRAVGALRGDPVSIPAGIETLVAEYRTSTDAATELVIDGDYGRLTGATGEAILRVVQEALTNVRKHAPGAEVSVAVHAGERPDDEIVAVVDNRGATAQPVLPLSTSGGGYGLKGMRERAQALGGSVSARVHADGWRVELHLPPLTTPQAAAPALAEPAQPARPGGIAERAEAAP